MYPNIRSAIFYYFFFLGPVVSLFQESYFDLIKHSLRPGGIVCSQADTIWGHMRNVLSIHKYCKAVFPNAVYASTNVSTYPAGQIGLELGSLDEVKIQLNLQLYAVIMIYAYLSYFRKIQLVNINI